jgi:putative SOS response-associated peptidase YedK
VGLCICIHRLRLFDAAFILKPDDYDVWLDPGMTDVEALTEFLRPFDTSLMRSYPVSTRVNQVQNDDAECCGRVELLGDSQHQLFS